MWGRTYDASEKREISKAQFLCIRWHHIVANKCKGCPVKSNAVLCVEGCILVLLGLVYRILQ